MERLKEIYKKIDTWCETEINLYIGEYVFETNNFTVSIFVILICDCIIIFK